MLRAMTAEEHESDSKVDSETRAKVGDRRWYVITALAISLAAVLVPLITWAWPNSPFSHKITASTAIPDPCSIISASPSAKGLLNQRDLTRTAVLVPGMEQCGWDLASTPYGFINVTFSDSHFSSANSPITQNIDGLGLVVADQPAPQTRWPNSCEFSYGTPFGSAIFEIVYPETLSKESLGASATCLTLTDFLEAVTSSLPERTSP